MEFRLLGRAEAQADGVLSRLTTKPRTLLAACLLNAGHVVSVSTLVAAIAGADHGLYHKRWAFGWGNWEDLGGEITSVWHRAWNNTGWHRRQLRPEVQRFRHRDPLQGHHSPGLVGTSAVRLWSGVLSGYGRAAWTEINTASGAHHRPRHLAPGRQRLHAEAGDAIVYKDLGGTPGNAEESDGPAAPSSNELSNPNRATSY